MTRGSRTDPNCSALFSPIEPGPLVLYMRTRIRLLVMGVWPWPEGELRTRRSGTSHQNTGPLPCEMVRFLWHMNTHWVRAGSLCSSAMREPHENDDFHVSEAFELWGSHSTFCLDPSASKSSEHQRVFYTTAKQSPGGSRRFWSRHAVMDSTSSRRYPLHWTGFRGPHRARAGVSIAISSGERVRHHRCP